MILSEQQRILGALGFAAFLMLFGTCHAADEPRWLSQDLLVALETHGMDAADGLYRRHRERGFVGVRESQGDTNALGYRLLGQGQVEAAIRVFLLNTETYPQSANTFDSLGEAYLAAGERPRAVTAYQQALALDPRHGGARYELARLSGRMLPPLPPMVLIHILAGVLSMLAGGVAMVAPKGRPVHRVAGKVFVGAMLTLAGSAVLRAAQNLETEILNFWMGALTLYLVISGWRAARHRTSHPTFLDWILPIVALTSAAGLLVLALRGGASAGPALVFGIVAVMATGGDVRWFRRTPSEPARRLVRHLWRMGLAMFISVGSLFLGQPHVFPYEIRNSGLLIVPPMLVAIVFAYWFFRYRFARQSRRLPPLRTVSPQP